MTKLKAKKEKISKFIAHGLTRDNKPLNKKKLDCMGSLQPYMKLEILNLIGYLIVSNVIKLKFVLLLVVVSDVVVVVIECVYKIIMCHFSLVSLSFTKHE